MNFDVEVLLKEKRDTSLYKPKFFDFSLDKDQREFEELCKENKVLHIVDDYEEELLELFGIQNPTLVYTPSYKDSFQKHLQSLSEKSPLYKQGFWVYYPWNGRATHILKEEEFFLVRTARNKNLITAKEQEAFYHAKVGIGGLSVGSSVALLLALQGGAKYIKLADMDRLALSNTNRILSGVDMLGVLKVELVARKMYEINPYLSITLYPEGISQENIDDFVSDLDVIIDELDNIAIKYLLREKAKQYKIPVVMGTDNGDNAVVDIERYDQEDAIPKVFFHGRMGNDLSYDALLHLDKFGIGKKATECVGLDNVTVRMQESLLEMGKTIVSWPQLGGAALINGCAVAYCVRKIINNQPLESNRALISLDEKLTPFYHEEAQVNERKKAGDTFKQIFGL